MLKCLMKYEWVKLRRDTLPTGKGIMGAWAKLAARAAYKTINALKSGRVLSCGCKYRDTRSEAVTHRRDMVEGTSVSSIVGSKHVRSNNTSGYTGVGYNKRTGKWCAYINFQKRHYNLGIFKEKVAAIHARRVAEAKLHDPIILKYWDSLTEKRQAEFDEYLSENEKKSE